jgi:hypothetical protein
MSIINVVKKIKARSFEETIKATCSGSPPNLTNKIQKSLLKKKYSKRTKSNPIIENRIKANGFFSLKERNVYLKSLNNNYYSNERTLNFSLATEASSD